MQIKNKYNANFSQRKIKSWLFLFLVGIGAFITVSFVLLIVLWMVIKGIKAFNFDMLSKTYNAVNPEQGGMGAFIMTTLMVLFLTICIAIPVCLVMALYLHQYCQNKKFQKTTITVLSVLNSIPSIIFGILGNVIFVITFHLGYYGFSILSGSLTLFLLITPALVIAMYSAFDTVEHELVISAYALGSTRLQVARRIILPNSLKSMTGGIILAVARVLGESTPVYLTIGSSIFMPHNFLSQGRTLVVAIFLQFQNPAGDSNSFIYALSLVLIFLLLVIIITIKLFMFFIDKTRISEKQKLKRSLTWWKKK